MSCVFIEERGSGPFFTGLQKTWLQGLLAGAEIGYQMEKCEQGSVFTCGFL